MKFKEIFLAGALLFSSVLASSQNKLNYEVRTEGGGFPSTNSSINLNSKEINFSFLYGLYSMKFNQINDSTYRETKHFLFKKEFFDYSKGSGYEFSNYSVERGKKREEKKALEKTIFNEKYMTFPELLDSFESRGFEGGDSLHFFLMGVPYSLKIERSEKGDSIIYSSTLKGAIKFESGDDFHFSYPIELVAKEEDSKEVILNFSTNFLNVKKGKKGSLEGKLKK